MPDKRMFPMITGNAPKSREGVSRCWEAGCRSIASSSASGKRLGLLMMRPRTARLFSSAVCHARTLEQAVTGETLRVPVAYPVLTRAQKAE